MEQDLKSIGYGCASVRTIIWIPLSLVPMMWLRELWDGSLASLFPYGVFAPIIFFAITYSWIRALLFGPFRAIQKFCNQSSDSEAMMARLEKVWNDNFVTKSCRIDDEYFILARKMRSVVIPLIDIDGIKYDPLFHYGYLFGGLLLIYLKDGTSKTFDIREKEGEAIEAYIKANISGIAVGKNAMRRLLKNAVGKIDYRHQIVKIRERYFIVDFSNPLKLSSYLSFGEIYRFREKGTKDFWRAWEISEEEFHKIKYWPFKKSKVTISLLISAGFLLGFLVLAVAVPSEVLSIHSIVRGQHWVLLLAPIILFLTYFVYLNMTSKFETGKFTEVRISRKEALYTKSQLFKYIVARICILAVLIFVLVGMVFLWNVGVFAYLLCIYLLFLYVFIGVLAGLPIIDLWCTIEKNDEPPTTFR